MKTALILDDRKPTLKELKEVLESQGYRVVTVTTLHAAKKAINQSFDRKEEFDLIVSDFDLSGKLWKKHHWFDGYFFGRWLSNRGVKSKIIFHSTAFEPTQRIRWLWHLPFIRSAEKRGITVQGKSVLMPSERAKLKPRKK